MSASAGRGEPMICHDVLKTENTVAVKSSAETDVCEPQRPEANI